MLCGAVLCCAVYAFPSFLSMQASFNGCVIKWRIDYESMLNEYCQVDYYAMLFYIYAILYLHKNVSPSFLSIRATVVSMVMLLVKDWSRVDVQVNWIRSSLLGP